MGEIVEKFSTWLIRFYRTLLLEPDLNQVLIWGRVDHGNFTRSPSQNRT